jgi:cysteine desulfurase
MGIYLDHAATTPIRPEVLDIMVPLYSNLYGNASSTHTFGREARRALTDARDSMSGIIGCKPSELIFTSGGTESDNMAIFGAAEALAPKGKHIITSQIEHHAVLHSFERLARLGWDVTYIPAGPTGRIQPEQLEQAIRKDTTLISIMHANNEVGTVQPIDELGAIARHHGVCFHVDAVQSFGKLPIRLTDMPVDLMSFSAHKINGPKGIGALYVNSKSRLEPYMVGGNQERKRRAGTENVPAIAGFSKALQLSVLFMNETQQNMEKLRQGMVDGLKTCLGDAFVINGDPQSRLPHILNVSFPGAATETMLMNLDMAGIAAASGSACTSGSLEPSHVLRAMNLPGDVVGSAIRFSFGYGSSMEQIELAAEKIATIVERIRISL